MHILLAIAWNPQISSHRRHMIKIEFHTTKEMQQKTLDYSALCLHDFVIHIPWPLWSLRIPCQFEHHTETACKLVKGRVPISVHIYTKDERGIPDRRGFPDRTVQPWPDSGHGAIFCLNRGSVRSGVKKTGRVGNGVVFSRCGYDFSVRGKILIEMK